MASVPALGSPPGRAAMEREANYAAVGAFVVLVLVLGTLFVYWYSDSREHRDYTRYEIYFEGSVSGLERGSAVRYLGVDVGRVVDMNIDTRDASRVQVIVDIDSSAPISAKTVAELSLQGVTGLLYIDLISDTGNRRLTKAVPSARHPVIRSARSNFDVFLSSLPDLVGLANEVVERANRLLSDENLTAVAGTLRNLDEASAGLPGTLREVDSLAAELRGAAVEIRAAAQNVNGVTRTAGPELVAAVQKVYAVAENLANSSSQLEAMVKDNRRDLRAFTRDGLPEFERFLRDGREAAEEIRDFARSLREDPSQLIYQPPPQGVEIPR
jgi:phospholipid/cholesterol/gamma-HCH transport system substrate-binding protein